MADQSAPSYTTNGAVWSRYRWVCHDGGYYDSSRHFTGSVTKRGGITVNGTNGVIGRATWFDGSDDGLDWGDIKVVDYATTATFMWWMRGENLGNRLFLNHSAPNGGSGWSIWYLYPTVNGSVEFVANGSAFDKSTSDNFAPYNTTTFCSLVFKASDNVYCYKNGDNLDSTLTGTPANLGGVGGWQHGIGGLMYSGTWQFCYKGWIDEIRISNETLSTNWLWACWYNQASNTSFIAYGRARPPLAKGTVVILR